MFLNEDIGRGDITSSMVKMPSNVNAEIVCKQKTQSVFPGLEEAKLVFEMCGCRTVTFLSRDGAVAKKGDRVLRVDADPLPLLRA